MLFAVVCLNFYYVSDAYKSYRHSNLPATYGVGSTAITVAISVFESDDNFSDEDCQVFADELYTALFA